MAGSFDLSPLWLLPFVLMLAAIAVLPLVAHHFWESNLRKTLVAIVLALPVAILYASHRPGALIHSLEDYASFIVMLGGLYIVSGGIRLRLEVEATPLANTGVLALGALIASFVGTTGASMLLIRPLLEMNRERRRVTHTVIFFILLVSNVGGCLTPLGDPPLFLGYLAGVPFLWTFRLWREWLTAVVLLLAIYAAWDRREFRREGREQAHWLVGWGLQGGLNLGFLLGIVAAVALLSAPWRDLAIVALTAVSYLTTPAARRQANHFTFGPILEVAALFIGVFVTMLPALDWLRSAGGSLGVSTPRGFFWATGLLSSALDNAPTYLAFLALAQGMGLPNEVVGVSHEILVAISLGAVFMGANTYIGNGPNFMVRAIAVERGIAMPSFVAYMLYALPLLTPVYLIVTFLFLR